MATTHALKTHPQYWDAVAAGQKLFEARKNDRFFQLGDTVELLRYDPSVTGGYTDASGHRVYDATYAAKLRFRIGHILQGGNFGIEPGYCVFSLLPLTDEAGA